ncbi:hypothetical protein BaRGS_00030154 [Batillaria attramentaria]|uniref:6-phosphogluconolactonase n=1 Tax=Batillaria attramentaria TaxID=370345 RepID=A0ABD0JVC8_9CAEN
MAPFMTVRATALAVASVLLLLNTYLHCYAAPQHTGIILIGGTGDLARKYLWQAFFNAYMKREIQDSEQLDVEKQLDEYSFSVVTGGRSHAGVATTRLKDIFDNNVKCSDAHGSLSVCTSKKGEFFDKVTYYQLQRAEDYTAMCASLQQNFERLPSDTKIDVVLYLSVPPSVFRQSLSDFSAQCDFSKQNVRAKVVLEKPQGHDHQSALRLSEELLQLFEEEQLHRTDHYLAKSLVRTIIPFRMANPQLERMLNRDHVDRVEIFLKETVGVEERHLSYNEMGVIRDIFQNHLTQLLTLVALDLPANQSAAASAIEKAKVVRVLQQVLPQTSQRVLLGQYAAYTFEADREIPESNITSFVPTFAAALVKIPTHRWRDVPFILVSGKKLDQRSSYIRIVFKDGDVCVTNCHEQSHGKDDVKSSDHHRSKDAKAQIVFQIGHGAVKLPLVSVSKSLGEPDWPDSLDEVIDSDVFLQKNYHGDHPQHFYHATPVEKGDAYTTVIEEILQGKRESFVSTRQLLLSWRVWDPVLEYSPRKRPRIYDAGDPASLLNFVMRDGSLRFSAADVAQETEELTFSASLHHLHQAQTPASFLGHRMVSGSRESVAVQLAREIEQAAEAEIAAKGVFHVAFSGGTSPILLWQTLAQSFASEYWAHVHVWQVDERCVHAAADSHSNLFQLDYHLLRFVAVPWVHVHAMPVELAGRLCDSELQGARLYSDSLRRHVSNLQLDFVVLGLGADGHTGSLFPKSPALSADSQTLVTLTDRGPKDTPFRMTLTLPMLNRAKRVAVLVTGSEKHAILEELEGVEGGMGVVDKYPILGVNPANGTMTWYVDYDAYLGGEDFDNKR